MNPRTPSTARWNRTAFATFALACLATAIFGCNSPPTPHSPAPQPPRPAEPVAPSLEPTAPSPSLAEELKAQGLREARDFERRAGVRLESVTSTAGPPWWAEAANDTERATGTCTAPALPDAFNTAVSRAASTAEARGVNPRILRVERASWMRLTTGAYVVWVSLGDGSKAADPAPPVDLPISDALEPAPRAPTAGSARPGEPPLAPDPNAPSWYSTAPVQDGFRLTIGSQAEAATERDAQRAAFKAGRTRIIGLIGAEPSDLTTVKSTTVTLPDGSIRAYTLVSCTGTIK